MEKKEAPSISGGISETKTEEQEETTSAAVVPEASPNEQTVVNIQRVASIQLSLTIAAIEKFQKVVRYKGFDGRIDPNGNTIKDLMAATPEYVSERIAGYPAYAAKKAREAEEAKAAKQAKEKADAEKRKAAAEKKKAEEIRIKAVTEEPVTEENIKRFIEKHEDMRIMANKLKEYASLNPKFVLGIFDELGFSEKDNLAYAIVDLSSDTELGSYDTEVITKMHNELSGYFNTSSHSANWKMAERVGKLMNTSSDSIDEPEERQETVAYANQRDNKYKKKDIYG